MACRMFKALFPFSGSDDSTLSFKQNDLLTVIQPVDENWFFGCLNDNCGFIPVKYVKETEHKDFDYMTKSVNACIAKLQAIPEKNVTKEQYSALKKLKRFKEELAVQASVVKEKQRQGQSNGAELVQQQQPRKQQQAPQKPQQQQQTPQKQQQTPQKQQQAPQKQQQTPQKQQQTPQKQQQAPQKPQQQQQTPQQPRKQQQAPQKPQQTQQQQKQASRSPKSIPANLSRQLVDAVRASTGGSHPASVQAVRQILATLAGHLSSQSEELTALIGQLAGQMSDNTDGESGTIDSRDWQAIDSLLSMAERRRRDWQERGGWSLHEQAGQVREELARLASLLDNADSVVARQRLRQDGCSAPLCLAELHGMETRPVVRRALIRCLASMCLLDRAVVDALLSASSLPTNLLAEADRGLLPAALRLLTMLLSARVQPPSAVVDALDEALFIRLFTLMSSDDSSESEQPVDSESSNDEDLSMAQSIARFLLAANNLSLGDDCPLAAQAAHERPLFRALLATPAACHPFTECILLVFNRSEDPTALLRHSPPSCDSVLKMLTDLFSHESTAGVFYSNDVHVLVDVICRELNNASPDSDRLSPMLQLLQNCLTTVRHQGSSFYKSGDLRQALRHLSDSDEVSNAVRDQCKSLSQLLSKGVGA